MISVVVPAWNEADQLPSTIASIKAQSARYEIVVVDAGSDDGTVDVARRAGAKVVFSPIRQRAAQMNLGAAAAAGAILLFLHADTKLPAGALASIQKALGNSPVVGGGFARRYDSRSLWLRLTCLLAEVRTRVWGWFFGDQAIFVRRDVFVALGGFRERDVFEDLDFARRMKTCGRLVTLSPPVWSAARRFERRGVVATTLRDLGWTLAFFLGRTTMPSDLEGTALRRHPSKKNDWRNNGASTLPEVG